MTPEGSVKASITKVLKRHGAYYHYPVMNGMGAPTLDIIVCHHGRFIAIEAKAPGKKPTPRQEVTIADMRKAGATVFVVSDETSLQKLDDYLGWVNARSTKTETQ